MSGVLIALVLAAAAAGWIYMISLRRTGGNKSTSLAAAIAVGFIVLIIALTLTRYLPN